MLSTLPDGKPVTSSAFSTRLRSSLFWAKSFMMLKWSRPEFDRWSRQPGWMADNAALVDEVVVVVVVIIIVVASDA